MEVHSKIIPYLRGRGIDVKKIGSVYRCSSPFSSDSDPSFTVYPATDSFYDFSNGFGGSFEYLVSRLEGVSKQEVKKRSVNSEKVLVYNANKNFTINAYNKCSKSRSQAVHKYALSRGITTGYEVAVIDVHQDGDFVKVPAILFKHEDTDGKVMGGKFRLVPEYDLTNQRFTARGQLGWYVLENIVKDHYADPILYIVESETSANSLYMYLKEVGVSAVVISGGAVGATPELPTRYKYLKDKRVIIDYDGDEEKFTERSCKYLKEYGGVNIVRIILPKGEDINSLYSKSLMFKIESII